MALGLDAIVEGDGSPQEEEGGGDAKHGQRWRLFGTYSWRAESREQHFRNGKRKREKEGGRRKEDEEKKVKER